MNREARFIHEGADGTLQCRLCPHLCVIPGGSFGRCGVRGNKGGKALLPFYGVIPAMAVDPIEKKPLYHFRPGSTILSIGFAGCNLRCPFCQNWRISQASGFTSQYMPPAKKPGDVVSAALRENSESIAYTYSEPLVHAEFLLECMALARHHGINNVLVTNGCITTDAAREILTFTDAANIDLKCFSHEHYANILGGNLETVCAFIKLACERKVHVELTTLVVPGFNDSMEELDACAAFIASLHSGLEGPPWHLSAYHPDYRWNAPPTSREFILRVKERAAKKLSHVYTGNISGEENDTLCLHCKAVLVRRRGYQTELSGLIQEPGPFLCASCGAAAPFQRKLF